MSYELHEGNAFNLLEEYPENRFHAVVTDPPYGVVEFETANVEKMRDGEGGVWRIPPELDGNKRKPLPRFTVLGEDDKEKLRNFFRTFGESVERVLRPGGHIFVATTQLLMHEVSRQLDEAGLERRDVLVRETKTLRGGDRPKGAHEEYSMVSSMPRVYWEPWLLYRKPLEGRLQDNLSEWGTGGLRRESEARPFTDLLGNGKTPKEETEIVRGATSRGWRRSESASKPQAPKPDERTLSRFFTSQGRDYLRPVYGFRLNGSRGRSPWIRRSRYGDRRDLQGDGRGGCPEVSGG